ncbi:unnamed protein product [Aureobasidium uvarum]|uniref:Zn(2)-C6 fungal-type domain-containing protein n=1 Tax=Aureobasidium uvarum TaxID=2773716 RepID=A0A9N8KB51_9PEZI|nr:unnamed protein product [Aureobasidium uvarum]
MSTIQEQSYSENSDRGKSRASKACARCRIKKQRCSGGTPCSNCKLADALCHFGNIKRTQRKMFPEHYVRALEAQQHKLETAVHTMYYRLLAANAWPGPKLIEHGGNPLVHDVLAVLGLLETTQEDRSRHSYNQPELGSPGGDESVAESPEQQYQERRNSLPSQPHSVHHSRNESNHSLPLVPEEARWFGGIPELLSRSATGEHSLTAPRRLDFVPPADSLSRSNMPAGSTQQQAQSLPSSFGQQQLLQAAGSSQNAVQPSTNLEAMNWELFDKSTAWWYGDEEDTGQQQDLQDNRITTTDGSLNLEGPCELDGLWQSTQTEVDPQAIPPDDETKMDRELPAHFFRIGW